MSRAEEIRAKADRTRARGTPAAVEHRAAPPVRTKPVRITTDLSPTVHGALKRWCFDTAEQLGRPVVHGQQVIEALIGRLLADPELAEQIRRTLAEKTD